MFGNKKKKAEKEYRKGLEKLSENHSLWAKSHFENAVELDPEMAKYWWQLGECLLDLERNGGVTMFTERMLEEGRADLNKKISQLPYSYDCFKNVQELDGPTIAICERLGLVASELEDHLSSIGHYKNAYDLLQKEPQVNDEQLSGIAGNIGVGYGEILHILAFTNDTEKILTQLGYYEKDGMIIDGLGEKKIPKKEFLKQTADQALFYYKQAYDIFPSSEIAQKNYDDFREFYEKNW